MDVYPVCIIGNINKNHCNPVMFIILNKHSPACEFVRVSSSHLVFGRPIRFFPGATFFVTFLTVLFVSSHLMSVPFQSSPNY